MYQAVSVHADVHKGASVNYIAHCPLKDQCPAF